MTSPFAEEPTLDFLRRLWALSHALERLSVLMERSLGVTAQQRLVLRCLGLCPGVTAGQLAELLHLDPGTVSTHLRRLVEKRLVERKKDRRDARRVKLVLTKRGTALVRQSAGTVEHAVEQMLARANAGEVEATKAMLEELARRIGDQRPRARRS